MSSELPLGNRVTDCKPMPAPQRVEHVGRFIKLRPLNVERDASELYRISNGSPERERVWTYLGNEPFESAAAMNEWLLACEKSTDPLFFTVIDVASDSPVGMVSFLNIALVARSIEVGHIWYAPEAQRGYTNTAAVYLLLIEAFETLGARRVEWKCNSLNARSRVAALRLGFSFEGVFRQHLIVKGRNRDTAWFSMLDAEWLEVREAMKQWLAWEGDGRPGLAELRARARNASA